MKKMSMMFAVIMAAFAAVGCASGAAPSDGIESTEQTLVVHYGEKELLGPDALIDLTLTHKVYVLDEIDVNVLSGLRVLTVEGERTLVDVIGDELSGRQTLVLGADAERVSHYEEGGASAPRTTRDGIGVSAQARIKLVCCDSCEGGYSVGTMVCSGCRGCDP